MGNKHPQITNTIADFSMSSTCTQTHKKKRHPTPHTSQASTLAIYQNSLCPRSLQFTVSLCVKSHSQLWRPLRITQEGINKHSCHEQEHVFYNGY